MTTVNPFRENAFRMANNGECTNQLFIRDRKAASVPAISFRITLLDQSFFKGSKNAFHDPKDQYNLSAEGKCYIAGLLKHAREITGICSQWVNSYKRLVPGYEAPVYVAWSRRNRSALVRVPMYKPGKEAATRCEYRAPDPACNPYLAFAAMITAGLKGIEKNYKLAEPVEVDIYHLSQAERSKLGIQELPGSLYEAVIEVEKSEVVKEALGEHIFNKFIENKKIEWTPSGLT